MIFFSLFPSEWRKSQILHSFQCMTSSSGDYATIWLKYQNIPYTYNVYLESTLCGTSALLARLLCGMNNFLQSCWGHNSLDLAHIFPGLCTLGWKQTGRNAEWPQRASSAAEAKCVQHPSSVKNKREMEKREKKTELEFSGVRIYLRSACLLFLKQPIASSSGVCVYVVLFGYIYTDF